MKIGESNFGVRWRDPSWYHHKRGWFFGWWFRSSPDRITILGFEFLRWRN